ncbi:MAG: DegT/DnrJ/EryC1/StrS family aminotransferase [Arenicella sp.]|nr:DegT/DnrJ/EryC1/StrS family aminotransferase [Arenicella sp.]
MAIPFIDLSSQYQQHQAKIDAAIHKVLAHGQYIMGPEVKELESQLAEYVGAKHCLACSSGTDALVIPLMAKGLGIGDAVFTSPFTFFASAESISLTGATPVFVDIDPDSYNMDPASLEQKIKETLEAGKLTPRGIIPVDLFGIAADYDVINDIAKKYNLFVLEDAAQAFGAAYKDRRAGGLAELGATSFYPAKPLGCYGDGGAIFSNNDDTLETMISLRVHGQATSGDKYDNVRIGLNGRMDTIQAAILLEKLKVYDQEIERRNQVASEYTHRLKDLVKTPVLPDGHGSVWAQYSIQHPKRETIRTALSEQGIPTAVFYPKPIHLSTAYKDLNHGMGDFPVAEAAAQQIFSLPMHPYLETSQVKSICDSIEAAITNHS